MLNHRFDFQRIAEVGYDGGQVRVSVNGAPFEVVPEEAFSIQGYNGVLGSNNPLQNQSGFTGRSPGFDDNVVIRSAANLGSSNAGDVVRLQFLVGWDKGQIDKGTPTKVERGRWSRNVDGLIPVISLSQWGTSGPPRCCTDSAWLEA